MRTQTTLTIDNEAFTIEEAARFLEMRKEQLQSILSRNPEFGYKGFTITRTSPLRKKRGTIIKRASDKHEWNSIKDCAAELGLKAATVELAIRTNQRFEHLGETYFAPDYKPQHRNQVNGRSKKFEIVKPEQPQLNSLKVENVPHVHQSNNIHEQVEQKMQVLTTEQKCFAIMQQLAIERIRNAEYIKASKVLNALKLLSDEGECS
jgi:hypothetical protein